MDLTPSIPTRLGGGRYLIQEVLGEGGSAWVLLAHDTRMDVNRAIKLLHPRMSHATGNRARFKNEARAQAGLKHPNILMVHDVVEDDDGLYLVMELAEGGSLANRVEKGGPLPVREVIDIGATLCRALQEAHSAGVIHRDIKPGNILVDRSGVIKLADFGIARVLDRDVRLTETGMIIGTWAYMPPEQRDASAPADPRSDIYALGVTLYYLLTGASEANLHNRESHERAFAGLPPGICSVIQRATRMYPDDRYPTCAEFAQDLHLIAQSPELMVADPPTRPVSPAAEGRTLVPRSGQTGPKTPVLPPAITAVPPTSAVPREPVEAPAPRTSMLPWVAAAGAALVGLVSLALAGMILIPRFLPTQAVVDVPAENLSSVAVTEPPAAPPEAPLTPPETAPPAATAQAPSPSAASMAQVPAPVATASTNAASPNAAPPTGAPTTPPGTTGRTPRVISVLADPKAAEPGSAVPTSSNTPPPIGLSSDRIATGTVLLRTIPSGATVSEGGVTLRPGPSGGYDLPVGSHVLDVRSPVGEPTRLPVFVRSGQTITICHSFDTNSACGSEP